MFTYAIKCDNGKPYIVYILHKVLQCRGHRIEPTLDVIISSHEAESEKVCGKRKLKTIWS